MKRLYIILILSFGALSLVRGQDQAIYTQYNIYPILINPALTGFNQQHEILFNFRNSAASFPGTPKSYTLSYNGSIVDRIGLGAMIFSENVGVYNRFRGNLSYAYAIDSDDLHLSFGLSTEIQRFKLDNEAITSPFYDPNDELALEALDGVQFFDVALGIYLEYEERFFAGLSFPNLVKSRIDQSSIDTDTGNPAAGNFMALVGYRFDIENHDFMVEPSILIKSFDGAPFQADLNLKMSFIDEQLIGGLVYSFGNVSKVGILIGTRIDALTISYSYDIGLSDFQDYHNGGHEISVGYAFGGKSETPPAEPVQN